jgi:hypothetical protein
MTTILSPNSSPSVSYNIEGRNIQSYTAAGNFFTYSAPDPTHATPLVSITQHNIVLAEPNAGYAWGSDVGGFILPEPNIGDLFEIYNMGTASPNVLYIYFPSSDTVDGNPGPFNVGFGTRVVVRFVAANTWRTLVPSA